MGRMNMAGGMPRRALQSSLSHHEGLQTVTLAALEGTLKLPVLQCSLQATLNFGAAATASSCVLTNSRWGLI